MVIVVTSDANLEQYVVSYYVFYSSTMVINV